MSDEKNTCNDAACKSETSTVTLEVVSNGHRLKLMPRTVNGLKRLGYAAPSELVIDLLKQFGPIVTQALITWLLKRSTRTGGLLDDISLDAARHMLANLILHYKSQAGDQAKAWVEAALTELAAYVDTTTADPPLFG